MRDTGQAKFKLNKFTFKLPGNLNMYCSNSININKLIKIVLIGFLFFPFILGCNPFAKKQTMVAETSAEQKPIVHLSEFIISPGDSLKVQVWRHADLNKNVLVPTNGLVTFPLLGSFKVSGMGLSEFQSFLTERFNEYVVKPLVSVEVSASKANKTIITGEVNKPGIYSLEQPMTVYEAIANAGGFNYSASKGRVRLIRKQAGPDEKPMIINVGAIMKGKNMEQNVYLQSGDILYVPRELLALKDSFLGQLARAFQVVLLGEQTIIAYPQAERVITGRIQDGGTILIPANPPIP